MVWVWWTLAKQNSRTEIMILFYLNFSLLPNLCSFPHFCWLSSNTVILPMPPHIASLTRKAVTKQNFSFHFPLIEMQGYNLPSQNKFENKLCFIALKLSETLANSKGKCWSCCPAVPHLSSCESASCVCRMIPQCEWSTNPEFPLNARAMS